MGGVERDFGNSIMGQSTDGIICFGVDFCEELPWAELPAFVEAEFDEVELDEILAFCLAGLEPVPWARDGEAGRDQWWQYRDARNKILKDSGVELVLHCSGNCPMYILALTSTVMRANRGDPVEFSVGQLAEAMLVGSGKLRTALAALGHADREPKFLLCSNWD